MVGYIVVMVSNLISIFLNILYHFCWEVTKIRASTELPYCFGATKCIRPWNKGEIIVCLRFLRPLGPSTTRTNIIFTDRSRWLTTRRNICDKKTKIAISKFIYYIVLSASVFMFPSLCYFISISIILSILYQAILHFCVLCNLCLYWYLYFWSFRALI